MNRGSTAMRIAFLAGLACVIASAMPRASQQPHFRSGVQAVEIYASITDADGRPLRGLRREQFAVLEDGAPQRITAFAEGEFPLSLAVVIDRSWSMAGARLARAKRAARALVMLLRSDDQVTVIGIGGEVETLAPLARDRDRAVAAIDRLDPWSTTALRDAIVTALERVQTGTGRRALVLLTDGVDRYSRTPPDAVLAAARDRDVLVYPLVLGHTVPPLLAELAAVTGGRAEAARDDPAATTAVRSIATELHEQYLIGYVPSAAADGRWHAITVRVDAPGARVRARAGYRAR